MPHVSDGNEYTEFFARAAEACKPVSVLRKYEDALRSATRAYDSGFSVALVGRIKQGKSTLMNALVGELLAPVGVLPTTATINVFQYGRGSPQVIRKDGSEEAIPLSEVDTLFTGSTPDVIERIRETEFINFYCPVERLKNRRLVDTPGTDAAIQAHEEIVRSFLREAAAIIYVMEYPGREEDLNTLRAHQGDGSMGSSISNSLVVLHKWEAALAEESAPLKSLSVKAEEVAGSLRDTVRVVIPVSGALAFCVRHAPEDWWNSLIGFVERTSQVELTEALFDEKDSWRLDPERSRLRDQYPHLNWPTFRLICCELKNRGITDLPEAHKHFLELSQIERLENEMQERFFSKARLIKLSKLFQMVAPHMDSAGLAIRQEIDHAQRGIEAIRDLSGHPLGSAKRWLAAELHRLEQLLPRLEEARVVLDKEWASVKRRFEKTLLDLEITDNLDELGIADRATRDLIKDVLENPQKKRKPESAAALTDLVSICRRRANSSTSRRHRDLLEHAESRLTSEIQFNQ